MYIASFDIGKKNFAFCIEEVDTENLSSIENIPKNERYNIDGTCTDKFQTIIDKVCSNGKIILYKNSDLTENCISKKYLEMEHFHNMSSLLDEFSNYWDICDTFIIEQQMSFGKKHNTMALKLGQHCYSYFLIKYGRNKHIVEFPSYYKTQILGAKKIQNKTKKGKITYKAIDKPARKKWSVSYASYILANRAEYDNLCLLGSNKKSDDLADILCQLQAYKYLIYVDKIKL